jgi:low affinity Fe/Cu permease
MEQPPTQQSGTFGRLSHAAARLSGRPWALFLAVLVIVAWLISGPAFGFSDTWQLIINTSTTIVTFLMVFLIQNSQNRDTAAIQIKLDELIRAVHGAQNALFDLEDLDDAQLETIRAKYAELARAARRNGDTPEEPTRTGASTTEKKARRGR